MSNVADETVDSVRAAAIDTRDDATLGARERGCAGAIVDIIDDRERLQRERDRLEGELAVARRELRHAASVVVGLSAAAKAYVDAVAEEENEEGDPGAAQLKTALAHNALYDLVYPLGPRSAPLPPQPAPRVGPTDVVVATVSVACPACDAESGDYCTGGNRVCSERIHEAFEVMGPLLTGASPPQPVFNGPGDGNVKFIADLERQALNRAASPPQPGEGSATCGECGGKRLAEYDRGAVCNDCGKQAGERPDRCIDPTCDRCGKDTTGVYCPHGLCPDCAGDGKKCVNSHGNCRYKTDGRCYACNQPRPSTPGTAAPTLPKETDRE
jgi:hypothetical protein